MWWEWPCARSWRCTQNSEGSLSASLILRPAGKRLAGRCRDFGSAAGDRRHRLVIDGRRIIDRFLGEFRHALHFALIGCLAVGRGIGETGLLLDLVPTA